MEEMKKLIKQLQQYSFEYYTLGQPSVTDETYDSLYDKLVKLEKETGIILSGSPTQSVGGQVLDKLKKVKHEYPLLSLNKTKKVEDIDKFRKGKTIIEMDKEDGLTIDITYDNGELILGESRGDGDIGEDITHNVKQFTNVPLTIPYKKKVHIIGEAIITYDVFDEINSKLPQDKQFKNPRNLVSGSTRQLDSNICKERKVKFIGYIVKGNDMLQTKQSQFNFIIEQGFDCVNYTVIEPTDTIEYIKTSLETMKEYAKTTGNPIDGQVFTYDDIAYGESLGKTSHHPLHSIAFKFTEDVELTTLREVEWNVSRTGRVNPVAIFDTVELAGTDVSRATLNNLTILKSLQLGIGDTISVKKANEIIPMIVDNLTKSNTLEIPTVCPDCGERLIIKDDTDSEFLYCTNDNCKAKLVQKLTHYVSRNALNIEGLSEATIEKFIKLGYIKSIQDIYYLANDKCKYKNEIIKLDGFGKKSFENLVDAINKSKQCKLESFIFGLGIENIGKSTAKNMVEYCKGDTSLDTINNIINTLPHIWTEMKDCGKVVSNSIHEWFSDKNNLEMVGYLAQMELTFIEDKPKDIIVTQQTPFQGKSVYPTGGFHMKKQELKELLESLGAIVETGYKKSLDYLICGHDMSKSNKDKRALDDNASGKSNITLITEDEFLQIIKGN